MHIRVTIKQVHIDLQVRYENSDFKTLPSLAYSSIILDSAIALGELFDFSVHSSVNLLHLPSKLSRPCVSCNSLTVRRGRYKIV